MVEIQLYKKEGGEDRMYHFIDIANETHGENFQMVTYNIYYKTEYSYWVFWIKRSFYLYFMPSSSSNATYEYYVSDKSHVVDQVRVYYSNLHRTIPLIISIKRKDGIKYYTYKFLIDKKSSYGLPSTGNFEESELDQKLEDEHNRRNKLVFSLQYKSQNYKQYIQEERDNFIQYKYSVHETNYNGPFWFSTDKLFEFEKDISLDSIFFSSLNDRSFDFISVFYTQTKIALLVEFDSDSSMTYFRRKDKDGYYWEPYKESNLDMMTLPNTLEEINRDCQDRVSYQLKYTFNNESNYKANKIKVDTSNIKDYFKYSHTPQPPYDTMKSNVLCNGMLIQLEKNSDLSVPLLDKIQEIVYSTIVAYAIESPNTELPYLLELKKNSVKYYLQRMDGAGEKWRQIDESADPFSDDERKKAIIKEVEYYNKNLLIILINKGINDSYMPQLIGNSSSLGQTPEKSSSKIKVIQGSNLPESTYKPCIHDFSEIITLADPEGPKSDISGLRLFIGGTTGVDSTSDYNGRIELMTYDPGGTKREYLEFKKSERNEGEDKVYVYFYGSDNVPLLVYYNTKWFIAKSKDEYFKKWIKISSLNTLKPNSSDKSEIKKQLDHINKDLNQIQIDITSGSYGLDKDSEKMVAKFDSTRVTVKKTGRDYIKFTHTTRNSGPIGKVFLGSSELLDKTDKPITTSSSLFHNRVSVHYHKTDGSYKFPLLIGIGSDKTTSGLFYERVDGTEASKWEKVADISKIQEDGPDLTYKVNHVHYKITKSLKIQMEKKVSDEYDVNFIENCSSSISSSSDSDGSKINVSECSNGLSGSPYKCRKHTILLKSQTGRSVIGGIRIFLYNIELMTFDSTLLDKSPIFYDISVNDVHIYFYSTSDVPLLFEYGGKYYGPSTRDQYFEKWVPLRFATEKLSSNLDNINSTLNQICFSHTKNNTFYGIPYPSNKPPALKDDFYNRIKVEACKNNSYRKVTHTTLNSLPIKNIVYNGKPIRGIQDQRTENRVCVYYDPDDFYFTKPLLIKVCSSTGSSVYESYSRNNIHGTDWKKESISYDSDSKLLTELKSIQSRCFLSLNVIIEKQEHYNNIVSNDNKNHTAQIKIDKLNVTGGIKVEGYRCFQHELYNYYQEYNGEIKSRLSIIGDLTFELVLSISGQKIHLCDKNENIIPILTYGNPEALMAQSVYVYFYEIVEYINIDLVPLLIHYNDSFYAPQCKDSYFEKWKPIKELEGVTNLSHDRIDRLLPQLDKINLLLNEIDLSKKGDYGIPYCGKATSKGGNYYENNGFNTKRINVSTYRNDKYIMRIHSTVNKYNIGNIMNIGSHSFGQHSNQLKSYSITQISVVFELPYMISPKLIFLNARGIGSFYTTNGYYYDTNSQPGKPMKYKFIHLSLFSDLIESLKNGTKEDIESSNNSLQNITGLLNEITKTKMNEVQNTPDLEVTKCKDKDSESGIGQCPVIEPPPPPPPEPARPSPPTQSNGKSPLVLQAPSSRQIKSPGVEKSEPLHPQIKLQPQFPPGLEVTKTSLEIPGSSTSVQVDQLSQRTLGGAKGEQISGPPSEPAGVSLNQDESVSFPEPTASKPTPPPPKSPEMPESSVLLTSNSTLNEESSPENSFVHRSGTEHNHQSDGASEKAQDRDSDGQDHTDSLTPGPSDNSVGVPRGGTDNGSSGHANPELPKSPQPPGTGSENKVHEYITTGTKEFDDIMNKAIDYTVKNPGVVGGASGGVATAAGGSYPLYKYVFRCKK